MSFIQSPVVEYFGDPCGLLCCGVTDASYLPLLGLRGKSTLEAGYVYAPYIPLYETPNIVLDTFAKPAVAVEYTKKQLNPMFYVTGTLNSKDFSRSMEVESAYSVALRRRAEAEEYEERQRRIPPPILVMPTFFQR